MTAPPKPSSADDPDAVAPEAAGFLGDVEAARRRVSPVKPLPDLTDEQKARCREIWDGESIGELHDFEQIMQEGIALGQQTARDVQAEAVGYVACRQCDECGHVGINDDHDTDAACGECGWAGESPAQDHCPECNRDGTMAAACPKCSGHYSLLADTNLPAPVAAPPASDVQPVGAVADERDPADVFMDEVRAELKRARAKFPGDRIMTIALAEEFGELCKAVLDENAENVRKEAVQTAVMACRVAIDGDGSVREWRTERGLDPIGADRAAAPALQGESGATCDLRNAAQALVDRWDTPLWKDVPHTGEFIAALRRTLVPHPAAAQDAAGEQS